MLIYVYIWHELMDTKFLSERMWGFWMNGLGVKSSSQWKVRATKRVGSPQRITCAPFTIIIVQKDYWQKVVMQEEHWQREAL
jgi:hypothetical protein